MKQTLLLLLALLFTAIAGAQIINIPDTNLKARLLQPYYGWDQDGETIIIDANGDQQIQQSEALAVYGLNLGESNISNLTGIEHFTNLRELYCHANEITELNLQGLPNLENITCTWNPITSLDLSGMASLKIVACGNCELTSLNLDGLINLEQLICGGNNISTLNLSDLSNLKEFYAGSTPLTSLDVSPLESLEHFSVGGHLMPFIDVSSLQNLLSFTSVDSPLEVIDVTNNPNLIYLQCYSNPSLQYIFMKNGNNLIEMDGYVMLHSNPSLTMVCTDDGEIEYLNNHFEEFNMNVNVNSYCSFAPGGDYNTITGSLTLDADGNGCGGNDALLEYVRVNVANGTDTGATYTNLSGIYNIYAQEGNFTLTPEFANDWFTVTPASATIDVTDVDGSILTHNFCVTPNGIHPDIEVIITPLVDARPGFDAAYKLVYRNKGNQALSGNVTFTYQDDVTDFISASPAEDIFLPGVLTWNYTNLQPFERKSVIITINVNGPMETPAINIGDELEFAVQATSGAQDETPEDNQFGLKQIVIGSLDPNDITCMEGNMVAPERIGEFLHYNINFENIGTAAAEFIVVENFINPEQFDINSLEILNASHAMAATIEGNKLTFRFDDINLGPEEKGNIVYKIKTLGTLQENDVVMQEANIFFDYNFPLMTNQAETIFAVLGTPLFRAGGIAVYPNPTEGFVNISSLDTLQSLKLYDLQGRLLQDSLLNNTTHALDVSGHPSGLYLLEIRSASGVKVEKIVRK
jgi:hypothetical protein